VSTPTSDPQPTPHDDPILDDDDSPDLLGRSDFADSAAAVIENLRRSESSSVIALIGAWGAGKSSMLNMLRRRINPMTPPKGNPWIIVDFNPWYYSDLESLQAGFFRELIAALPLDHRWNNARTKIASIGKATAPLTSVFSLVGLDPSAAVKKAAELIGGDDSVSALHESANKALQEIGQPVLMVLDDLDRLSPDELLMVFKLLRLTGRLKNVHYLVSYDEDSLLDILSRTGLVGESDAARAVDYLEKMVQVRLDLPPLRESQVTDWLDAAISEFAERLSISTRDVEFDRFASVFSQAARWDLNTPRSIHRFISQARAFLPENTADVDLEDYLILAWLRSSRPLLFSMIQKYKNEFLGTGRRTQGSDTDKAAAKEAWRSRLKSAQVEEEMIGGISSVLSNLFPPFQRDSQTGVNVTSRGRVSPPRIGNPDYFDRYFNFGVPAEDISDSSVEAGYKQIASGAGGDAADNLRAQMPLNARLVITKIASLIDSQVSLPAHLALWLAEVDTAVPIEYEILGPHRQLRRFGGDVFLRLPPSDVQATTRTILSAPGGINILSDWTRFAKKNPNSRSVSAEGLAALQDANGLYVGALEEYFHTLEAASPLDVPSDKWYLIWEWHEVAAPQVREFLKNKLLYSSWTLLDTIARLVSTGYVSGVREQIEFITGLELSVVDELFGLDFVYKHLRDEIDGAESPPWSHHSVTATDDTRRSFALQVLKAGEAEAEAGQASGNDKA
jgi:hypothetical protein